jgi:hypothetical protein
LLATRAATALCIERLLRRGAHRLRELGTPRAQQHEITAGDGILELLPKKALIDQDVEVGRQLVAVLALEKSDRSSVLFTAKNELRFAFTASDRLIHRHRGAQHDRHHAHRDEERGHGIAALASFNFHDLYDTVTTTNEVLVEPPLLVCVTRTVYWFADAKTFETGLGDVVFDTFCVVPSSKSTTMLWTGPAPGVTVKMKFVVPAWPVPDAGDVIAI